MGAVTFSIDTNLIRSLKRDLALDVFVETGTFDGATVDAVKDIFPTIYSIELSPEKFEKARSRFDQSHINLIFGDSSKMLAGLAMQFASRSTLYFLDAHWCAAENTAGIISQCPLIDEILAIGILNHESAIIIDDARLFLSPPTAPHDISQWPSFNQVLNALKSISSTHVLQVLNDTIIFIPEVAEASVREFSHLHGVDWLAAMTVFSMHESLWTSVVDKEHVIQEQARGICSLQAGLAQKDLAIADLQAALGQKEGALAHLQAALATKDKAIADLQLALAGKEKNWIEIERALAIKSGGYFDNKSSSAKMSELEEKEAVIQELSRAIDAYKAAHFLLSPIGTAGRIGRRLRAKLTPRLGNLYQHSPMPMFQSYPYKSSANFMDLPSFSLVTPSFNQGHFIERTILSIVDQGYPKTEYVVQDGGSTDDTVTVLKKYEGAISRWESQSDSGQSQAINRGFSSTTGEIMAWLNSDDILLPGALACVADYFIRHPEVDVVYGNRLLIDENDMQIGRWILPGHDGKVLSWADFVPQETLFWRRSIWDRVDGKIDESFRFAMDWDLLLRFRNAGACFAHIPRFLGAFRIHAHQKTSAAISEVGYAEMDRLRERELGRKVSHIEIRKAVSTFLIRHLIADGSHRLKRIAGIPAQ